MTILHYLYSTSLSCSLQRHLQPCISRDFKIYILLEQLSSVHVKAENNSNYLVFFRYWPFPLESPSPSAHASFLSSNLSTSLSLHKICLFSWS